MAMRTANVKRQTKETDIDLVLDIDGTGKSNINTGIGFFNHMLEGFSKHGFFDLTLKCDGDLDVDCHHTIEDCGIVLGNAIKEAIGDKLSVLEALSFLWMKHLFCVRSICQDVHICSLMHSLALNVSEQWIPRW